MKAGSIDLSKPHCDNNIPFWFVLIGLSVFTACVIPTPGAEQTTARKPIFRDPAPPVVKKLVSINPPPLKPNPDVILRSKPKPLLIDAITHDWKSFLGPTHNATSTETRLLRRFPARGPDLAWEMKTGEGYSSPAVVDDRLVYFHRVSDEERVECLHPETGERYWKFSYTTKYRDRYGYSNGPRASPVTDGDLVYTYGAQGKLHCLNLRTGQLVWKRDLSQEFKVPQDFFGATATPLIEGDRLIINIGSPGGPTVAAFDKMTGKMLWGTGKQWGPSYASPVPATVHEKRRVFAFVGGESRPPVGGLLSIDALTGKVDFSFSWRSRSFESVNASSPIVIGNQVFVSASYRTGGVLLNLLPNGTHSVAWTTKEFNLHWNTPIHRDGYLYGFHGRNKTDAQLVCLRLQDGKVIWRKTPEWQEVVRVNGETHQMLASTLRGSMLWANGRFLVLGEHGHLLWLDLSPRGYREISRARLFLARQTWTAPVISRGLLYVCQNSRGIFDNSPPRLLCYNLRAEK